jgi:hypothetical protein
MTIKEWTVAKLRSYRESLLELEKQDKITYENEHKKNQHQAKISILEEVLVEINESLT